MTPPGLTTVNTSNQHSLNVWLNSVLSQNMSNEFRVAWSHLGTDDGCAGSIVARSIPSLEISELGMTGFNAGANRTAIGLAVNLPQFRYNDTYQFQNNLTYVRGDHLFKAGFDIRRQYVKSFFFPTIRGLLRYTTLRHVRQRRRRGSEHQQAAAGWGGSELLPLVGSVLLRPGRVAGLARPDVEPRPALRVAGEQHRKPDRPEGADPRGQRQQPGLRTSAGAVTDKNNFQPRIGFNWSPSSRTRAVSWAC